ncbi:MAG: glutathione peroxidase [Roseobacter sp. MedPE-SW]|nr:MAG: glutathione peroxidase [Roseobacter sp. MedPE-SW]
MGRIFVLMVSILTGYQVRALDLTTPFASIDGGTLALSAWHGQPILIVNTASKCGFTKQYSGLQSLYETYRDAGLIVFAVPSNDFRQELTTEDQVKNFCELEFGIDLPMAAITQVSGPQAHPFYHSLMQETGFQPKWNFTKVLIGPEGELVATYSPSTRPQSAQIRRDIEGLLQ